MWPTPETVPSFKPSCLCFLLILLRKDPARPPQMKLLESSPIAADQTHGSTIQKTEGIKVNTNMRKGSLLHLVLQPLHVVSEALGLSQPHVWADRLDVVITVKQDGVGVGAACPSGRMVV